MSDEEQSAKESQQEEEEEVENPDPPLLVKREQITQGLSRIERTAGKFDCMHGARALCTLESKLTNSFLLQRCRWQLVRFFGADSRGDGPAS